MKKKVGIYGPWVDLVGVTFFSNPGLKKRLGGLKKKVRVEKNVGGLNKHPARKFKAPMYLKLIGGG